MQWRRGPHAPGSGEGGQRSFGIDAAAPVQHRAGVALFDAYGDVAGHGVDVAKQHHRGRCLRRAYFTHSVTGGVYVGAVVTQRVHALGKPGSSFSFVLAQRGSGNQPVNQVYGGGLVKNGMCAG
jgi:hypothetical protein